MNQGEQTIKFYLSQRQHSVPYYNCKKANHLFNKHKHIEKQYFQLLTIMKCIEAAKTKATSM